MQRRIGLPTATALGLGSIIGTGAFVSLGMAVGISGEWALAGILMAGFLALCNGLSSAQLASAFPVAGGTYEYGYRLLHPALGHAAGWLFISAKSASAAAAALGMAAYILPHFGETGRSLIAAAGVALMTGLTILGAKRTFSINTVVVSLTLLALLGFSLAAWLSSPLPQPETAAPRPLDVPAFAYATALIFVAFTGYGRIATMGEEIQNPRRSIPLAMLITLGISVVTYLVVTAAALHLAGATGYAEATHVSSAPLVLLTEQALARPIVWLVMLGAATAMLGVLLNLLLGISRVVLAMARRRDLPQRLQTLSQGQGLPHAALLATGGLIMLIALLADLQSSWHFSAFTVLIYYGLTNLAALRLSPEQRLYPRAFAWLGLLGCIGLAFMLPWKIWAIGLLWMGVGLLTFYAARRCQSNQA